MSEKELKPYYIKNVSIEELEQSEFYSNSVNNVEPTGKTNSFKEIYDDGTKPVDNATKNKIFAQNSAPTNPADDFKEGDLWFDSDDNNTIYRANAALAWVSVKDGAIAGKITTFHQTTVPTALAAGDIWFDSDDTNKPYRATNAGDDEVKAGEWVAINFADIGATVGATFGTNIAGGGSGNTQISNNGYATLYRQDKFGDGSDGDVTISSNTTLTSDMYYNDLTINAGFTLNPGGYRIFVKGTLTNNGTIARNGNAGNNGQNPVYPAGGVGGDGGATLANGTIYGGLAGATGGAGGAGGAGSYAGVAGGAGGAATAALGSNGVAGGAGGAGNGALGKAGGNGGAGGAATATIQKLINLVFSFILREFSADNTVIYQKGSAGSGAGGGGGAGDDGAGNRGPGGGGGGAGGTGGLLIISAKTIINNASKYIQANGGGGGIGGNGYNDFGSIGGGGGGGAGGNGGVIILIYENLTNSGTIQAVGGTGGAGGTGGNAGTTGANGTAGQIFYINV